MSVAHHPAYDPDRPVGYWQLLKQNPRFRTLWTAQLISAAGDWFNSVAVLGLVLQLTRSGLGASFVLLASTVPMFFLIPIAGPVVDRFDRRMLMILANLFSAVVALLFILVKTEDMVWLLYVASILLVVSASFFIPASSASIPNIVTRGELFSANALGGASWGIMVMVGSALGGIVSTLFGRDTAFVINALSFLIAAGLIALIEVPSPKTTNKQMTPVKDFIEGMRYLREYLPSLALVGIELGWGFGAGVRGSAECVGNTGFPRGRCRNRDSLRRAGAGCADWPVCGARRCRKRHQEAAQCDLAVICVGRHWLPDRRLCRLERYLVAGILRADSCAFRRRSSLGGEQLTAPDHDT